MPRAPPATGGKARRGADPRSWRGIAAETATRCPRRSRRCCGNAAGGCSATCCGRTGGPSTLTAAAIVIASLSSLAGPWLIGVAIDNGIPPLVKSGDPVPLLRIAAVFAVTVVVQASATRTFVTMTGRFGQAVVLELRRRLFAHVLRLPVSFHESYTSGRVISRQTSDVEAISELFDEGLDGLITAVLSCLLVGTGMLLLDWPLALVVLSGFIPLAWLSAWFRRDPRSPTACIREANALVIVHFVETFGGLRAVQAFRREKRNDEIFDALSDDYAAGDQAVRRRSTRSSRRASRWSGNVITGVVLCYGGLRVLDGDIKIGVLASFLLYLQRFFDPLQDVSQFYNTFQSAASALEKISGVLEEEPSVAEPALPGRLPAPARPAGAGGGCSSPACGSATARRSCCPSLTWTFRPGRRSRWSARPGAGKTTVARLLARFYDPDAGRVLLDGVDLRALPDDELRREIVLITQESFLFEGTVAENIRLGRPSATDEEVEAAARAIGAHTFIAALPDGYATTVGKRGGKLSAGQRQLISFCRAFIAAPSVLVLDEATALLDIPSERLVQSALRTVLAGRTALIIAHRLSTVAIADRVLVLRAGG